MAKENEKKLSADMSSDELENVSGGWCATGGMSYPDGIKKCKRYNRKDGSYMIVTEFDDGNSIASAFDKNGKLVTHLN